MFYKKMIQKRGIPLFLWCFCSVLYAPNVSAQCSVYFSYCPEDVTIVDCDDNGYEQINWPQPIAATTGGCTSFSLIQIGGPPDGSLVPVPGSYIIKYRATAIDLLTGKETKALCSFTVHMIQDTEPPVFTSCPPNITVYAGTGTTANASWPLPIVTDNCNAIVKTNAECNSEFEIGVHYIKYKAVDAAGNITYCVFTVTVLPGFMRPATGREENANISENSLKEHTNMPSMVEVFLLPNPFKDKLVINNDSGFESDVLVEIFDIQGRLLIHQIWNAHTEQIVLHSESVKSGIVFVKIVSSDGAFNKVLRGVKL